MDKTAKIRMKAKRNVTDLAGEKVMEISNRGNISASKVWETTSGICWTGRKAKTA